MILIKDYDNIDPKTQFVAFDIETTGTFYQQGDRIVEMAAVKFTKDQVLQTWASFVNPERIIPEEIQKIIGISNEDVAQAEKIEPVLSEFLFFITGSTLVGHNASEFDLNFINYVLKAYHFSTLEQPIIDTLLMSKQLLSLPSYKQVDLCAHFNIPVDQAHRALNDSQMCRQLFLKLWELSDNTSKIAFSS